MMTTPMKTPLTDLLRKVPADTHIDYENDQHYHSLIPVGRLCAEALAEIERLQKAAIALYNHDIEPVCMQPMTFNQLCKGCTAEERKALAEHLALLRMQATLELGKEPPAAPVVDHVCDFRSSGNMTGKRGNYCVICGEREGFKLAAAAGDAQVVALSTQAMKFIDTWAVETCGLDPHDAGIAYACKQIKSMLASASPPQEPQDVTDAMVKASFRAYEEATGERLPDADGADYKIMQAILEAALAQREQNG
jgi:hypothetical protein